MTIHGILYSIVFEYLEFYDKHTLRRIDKYMNKLKITDMYNIDKKYLKKLDDYILINYDFIVKLNAYDNIKISNVNHLKKIN